MQCCLLEVDLKAISKKCTNVQQLERNQGQRCLLQMRSIFVHGNPYDSNTQVRYTGSRLGVSANADATAVPWASLWKGPNHILFGHDAKRGLQKYPYATGLDTGCVYGGHLTACVIPILRGIEACEKLPHGSVPTLDDLGAQLVSVPARKMYLAPKE